VATNTSLPKLYPRRDLASYRASGIISPLLLGVKHWFDVQSEKAMLFMLIFVSFSTVAGGYLLSTPTSDPSIIALRTFVLGFTTQPIYFLLVKPSYKWLIQRLSEARALNAGAKAAALPPEGLPAVAPIMPIATATTPTGDISVETNDFSH
jgi:hypothetical protein